MRSAKRTSSMFMVVMPTLLCLFHGAGQSNAAASAPAQQFDLAEAIGLVLRSMPTITNPLEGHYDMLHPLIKRGVELGELWQTFQLNRRYDGGFGLDEELVTRGITQMLELVGNIDVSIGCRNAFFYVVPSIMNIFQGIIPIWIGIMVDAGGKYPMGSMRGSGLRKGNYHECVEVDTSGDAKPNKLPYVGIENGFQGLFCTVSGEYGKVTKIRKSADDIKIRNTQNRTRELFDAQVCIPNVCSNEDALEIVQFVAGFFFENFTSTAAKCHYPKEKRISNWTAFVIAMLTIIALCCIIGTAYDIWLGFKQREKPVENWLAPNDASRAVSQVYQPGAFENILLCFSVPRNMGNLLDRGDKKDPDELSFIHGIKFISLLWLVGVNLLLDANNRIWENYSGILEDLHTFAFHVLINGRFLAETSFCVSGFLVAFLMLKELGNQQGKYNTFYHIFHRYWRLFPAYMVTMLAASGIYYYSQDGPEWMETNVYEDSCKRHGWKGLLMINNFFTKSDSCPPLHWYIAVDFQLHLTAPLLIYPIYRNPRLGYGLLGAVMICLMAIAPLVTGVEKLPYFIGRLFFMQPKHEDYLDLILYKPWTHAGPFMIGILFGCLVSRHNTPSNNKINPVIVVSGWLTSIGIILVIMLGFYPYIDGGSKVPVALGIMYTALAPTLWSLAIGWILFSCATGHGGLLAHLLSWELFSPFSRLFYASFLVNGLVISHFFDSRLDTLYYDAWMMAVIFLGVSFVTLVSAIILSTTVERPFIELEKALFGYRRGVTSTSVIHLNTDDEEEDEDDEDDVLSIKEMADKQQQQKQQGKSMDDYLGGKAAFANSDQAINLLNSEKSSQHSASPASNGIS